MKNLPYLLKRELKLFFRNLTLISVMILAPVIYALLIGFVYKKGKVTDLPVIVVDQDNTPLSNQLLTMIEDNERLRVISVQSENTDTQRKLIDQNAVLAVVIPERFEADILQKRYPEVNTFINTSNLLTANMASQGIQTVLGTLNAGIDMQTLQKKGIPANLAASQYEPFKANYIRLFNPTGNYFVFMWPAILAVVLQQVMLLGLAVSFAAEIQNKTFGPGLVAHTRSSLVAIFVKAFPLWLTTIGILAFYYSMHGVFHAPMPSMISDFIVTTTLFILAVTFLGMAVSVLIPDALKATQVLMMVSTPAFLIGGFTWPLSSMPAAIQFLANSIPLTPFLNAHRILLIEDGSLYQVVPYLKQLGIQILVYGTVAIILLKLKIARVPAVDKADQ